jgi:hypothetical protein
MRLKVLQLPVDTLSGLRLKDNGVTVMSDNTFEDNWLWE